MKSKWIKLMLVAKRSVSVAPEINLKNSFETQGRHYVRLYA